MFQKHLIEWSQCLTYFCLIKVSEELKNLRNWQSFSSLIKSLQCPPIARLKQTWETLFTKHHYSYSKFVEFSKLFQDKDNLTFDYRGPCIPLFDHWLNIIKCRCAYQIKAVKTKRKSRHWSTPSMIVNWVFRELEMIKKMDLKSRKKKSSQTTGCFGTIFRSKSKALRLKVEKDEKDRITLRSVRRNFQNQKRYCEFDGKDKNKIEDEKMILIGMADINKKQRSIVLNEISQRLEEYQVKAGMYYFKTKDEVTKFILCKAYNSLDKCMKISRQLEPSNCHNHR